MTYVLATDSARVVSDGLAFSCAVFTSAANRRAHFLQLSGLFLPLAASTGFCANKQCVTLAKTPEHWQRLLLTSRPHHPSRQRSPG